MYTGEFSDLPSFLGRLKIKYIRYNIKIWWLSEFYLRLELHSGLLQTVEGLP